MRKYSGFVLNLVLSIAVLSGCSGSPEKSSSVTSNPTASNDKASLNKNDYPVFPDAEAGADPAVPAEQGGNGFKGEGWQTNTDFELIGDPRAVKGGTFHGYSPSFPGTLRMWGPEANYQDNYLILSSAYETLLGIDQRTLDFVPSLATHWKIDPDKQTYHFRINPNARWSDGEPVTSEDVVKSWEFFTDKTLDDPTDFTIYTRYEKPVAESRYIVSVKAKESLWRSFLDFGSGMVILPAHVLKGLTGADYLKDWNFKFLPGTGPYIVKEQDIDKGKSFTMRRRPDYWAVKARGNVGLNNFDEIKRSTVRDENLAFEMFKKGDLDYYYAYSSKTWVTQFDFDNVKRGVVQKVKVFTNEPRGIEGIAFNMRREPFTDVRVRKALTLLLNRKELIEKIMFNEYPPMNSYLPASVYENTNNPRNDYNPEEALKLLADAGWSSRDAQGHLMKSGKPLQLELLYDSKSLEPHLTVYQEDLRKVGITLNLRLITAETQFKLVMDRKFDMSLQSWSGELFPNPEAEWSGAFADALNNNNIAGFKDKRVDEIINAYNHEFDVQKRIALLKEMDGILANAYPYMLFWDAPFDRLAFWNKFGFPQGYVSRFGDYLGASNGPGMPQMWWIDPNKLAALNDAMKDPSRKVPILPAEDKYWIEVGKSQDTSKPAPPKTP